jgi:hypothetical protein
MTSDAPENKETFAAEELIINNSYEFAALVNILERNGLINKAEFLEEVRKLRKEIKRPAPPPDPDPYVMKG